MLKRQSPRQDNSNIFLTPPFPPPLPVAHSVLPSPCSSRPVPSRPLIGSILSAAYPVAPSQSPRCLSCPILPPRLLLVLPYPASSIAPHIPPRKPLIPSYRTLSRSTARSGPPRPANCHTPSYARLAACLALTRLQDKKKTKKKKRRQQTKQQNRKIQTLLYMSPLQC